MFLWFTVSGPRPVTRHSTEQAIISFERQHCLAKGALGEYVGVMGENQGVGEFEAWDLTFASSL